MATLKIKQQDIKHEDPDAAGFSTGYWWTLKLDDGELVESGAPTEDAARAAANAAADARNEIIS